MNWVFFAVYVVGVVVAFGIVRRWILRENARIRELGGQPESDMQVGFWTLFGAACWPLLGAGAAVVRLLGWIGRER